MPDLLARLTAKGVDVEDLTEILKWKAAFEAQASRLAKGRARQRAYWEKRPKDLTSLTSLTSETQNSNKINKALTSQRPLSISKEKERKNGSSDDEKADLYRRGRDVLGEGSGGLITQLITIKGNVSRARAALELASVAGVPKDYLAGILRNGQPKGFREANGYIWRSGIPGIM